MRASAARTATVCLPPLPRATLDKTSIFGFKKGQAGVEQIAVGHDDDVEPIGELVATENLSYQSFSAVSLDRTTQFLRRRDAQPSDPAIVGQQERRAVATAQPRPALVDALELGATPNTFSGAKSQATRY